VVVPALVVRNNVSNQVQKSKKLISLIVLLAVAALAAFGIWYFNYGSSSNTETVTTNQPEQVESLVTVSEDGKTVSYEGVEGENALSLLKNYTNVETEEFTGIGEYVVSINGVQADSNSNFWAFYVDDAQAQVGAGDYITKAGEKIEWRLEDVSAFQE
jgi:hypothetical protein